MGEPLRVIGIGDDGPAGLVPEARAHVEQAEVLAGGKRHLGFFPAFHGEKIVIDADRKRWLDRVKAVYRERRTVLLASGDPLLFGVGRLLLEAIPREEIVFFPHVSAVQLAFARLAVPWDDARIVSVHGRPLANLLPALNEGASKIAVLTDARNNPAAIARLLTERGCADRYELCVCENLGGTNERITRWSPTGPIEADFSPLNVVVLLATYEPEALATVYNPSLTLPARPAAAEESLLGIRDSSLQHQKEGRGLITKRELRVMTLCYLELRANDVLWDIGAGSGSVSIEAARLCSTLQVYAIEREAAAIAHIQSNRREFGVERINVIHGEAPAVLTALPDPNAVFVGGSGGRLNEILAVVMERLPVGGRLVMNSITLENFSRAWNILTERGWQPEATSVQLARTRPLGSLHCFEPEHPIVILHARKP